MVGWAPGTYSTFGRAGELANMQRILRICENSVNSSTIGAAACSPAFATGGGQFSQQGVAAGVRTRHLGHQQPDNTTTELVQVPASCSLAA
jgi:hypothetical protein